MIYRRPPRAAFVITEESPAQLYVMALPDGEVQVMSETAALIWLCAVEEEPDIPACVASELGIDPLAITDEVAAFLDVLVELRILDVVEPP